MFAVSHLALPIVLVALSPPSLPAQETFERNGVTFTRVPWGIERPRPVLTAEEEQRGWVCFVPGELDGIGPHAFPTRSEIGAAMRTFACAGEVEPATFGVYAVRDVEKVEAVAARLVGERGRVIPPWAVDIRTVRVWPQRTSWNARTYYTIPELLEKRYSVDIPAGALQQYWVTVTVPDDTVPGFYAGYVRVTAGSRSEHVPLLLRVLPFRLNEPAGKVYGLWPDTSRWRRYSDQQILEELADWKAHGIGCALMYPLTHGQFSLQEGKLQADLSEFERFMGLYVRAGLKGPVVASLQGLASLVHWLLGRPAEDYGPEFAALATEIAKRVEALRVEKGWPEFVYHTVDEPGGHAPVQTEAKETLRILHEAGLRTYTTADVDFANKVLDPFLDIRCYSIGYCARSAADAAARLAECRAAGDTYWWYGTGCYTGQEGSVAVNRHLGGFLFAKSNADGAWAWTFQRPQGSAYDDFDGQGAAEAKDACITYPSENGSPPLVPTLQWEGIREGYDDLRYLTTARSAASGLRGLKQPAATQLADRIEREINACLDAVPWLEGPFSSREAQVVRWKLTEQVIRSAPLFGKPGGLLDTPAAVEKKGKAQLSWALVGEPGSPPEPPLPFASAPMLSRAPRIDGELGEDWADALWIEDLVGQDGSPNKHRTEAWLARDARALYVAFRCHEDEMDRLRAAVTERDGDVWTDDSVEVFVDADGDEENYAHFVLNLLGTQRDSRHFVPLPGAHAATARPTEDLAWNAAWEGKAHRCVEGWSAELALPLASLGERVGPAINLNLNRTRRIAGGTEYGCWSPTLKGFNVPTRFGRVALSASWLRGTLQTWPPAWGENRIALTLDNRALVAELEAQVNVGGRAAAEASELLLGAGSCTVELDFDLAAQGSSEVTVLLTPRSLWSSAEAAERVPARRKIRPMAPRTGEVKPIAAAPTVIRLRRFLPSAVEVSGAGRELLQGWPGFDLGIGVNLSRRLLRDAKLSLSVESAGRPVARETLSELRGRKMFVNIGTSELTPGAYQVEARLEVAGALLGRSVTPFAIVRGPWE